MAAAPAFIRLDGRAPSVFFTVDGRVLLAAEGDSLAAALLAAGHEAPGPVCLMGSCYQCLVQVDGRADLRACRTAVRAGMSVTTARAAR